MKQLAYVFSAGLVVSMLALACDSSSTGGSTGTFGGAAGQGAGGSGAGNGGQAGTTSPAEGGSGGSAGSTTAGTNSGGSEPFGGGGEAGSGTAGSGTAGSGTAGSSTAGSGGSSSGQDCQECAQTSCAGELGTCQNNPSCAAIFQCIGGCSGDQACAQKCVTDNPNGTNDFNTVQGCLQTSCAEPCGSGGGGVSCTQIDLGDGANGACTQCGHANCCGELEACFGDADCVAFNQCLVDNKCQDQTCAQQCAQSNQAGAQLFNTVGQCIQGSCAAECQ